MKQPKSVIDKRYEDKHKEERKAAHAVWGTSMKREDFEELNKFLKSHHIPKVQLIYAGWTALKNNLIQITQKEEHAMKREHSIQSYKGAVK